jgi:transcriptional regulator with XRE-family HTH domain
MDDARLGSVLRRLRIRSGLRQVDVARRAGVSQSLISDIECGRVAGITLETLRSVFAAVSAAVDVDVRWRGPALDRLLDERHAGLVESSVGRLVRSRWATRVEVSYSIYGERGSIDVLGGKVDRLAVVVEEIKSDLVRVDDTVRKLDEKARLVMQEIAEQRFGWRPRLVGHILILPDTDRARRQVTRHQATLEVAFPQRGAEVRRWLRDPVGPMSGILFVANTGRGRGNATRAGIQRVRVGRRAPQQAGIVADMTSSGVRDRSGADG